MAYRVRIESFEGPFDLLLYLVSKQKVDIGVISISQITDQYLAEVSRKELLDLDIASDFLVVAATLLEIKAASLLPQKQADIGLEVETLEPNQARDILVERLLEYKKYKNAAASLQARWQAENRMHARSCGLEEQFINLMPDYLKNINLDKLAHVCADAFAKRDTFLLDSEHIAAAPVSVEKVMVSLYERVSTQKKLSFHKLLNNEAPTTVVVATFLAILELYKRSLVYLKQEECFGDIEIELIEGTTGLNLERIEISSTEEG